METPINNPRAIIFDKKVYEDPRTNDYYVISEFSCWVDDETERIRKEMADLPPHVILPRLPEQRRPNKR